MNQKFKCKFPLIFNRYNNILHAPLTYLKGSPNRVYMVACQTCGKRFIIDDEHHMIFREDWGPHRWPEYFAK